MDDGISLLGLVEKRFHFGYCSSVVLESSDETNDSFLTGTMRVLKIVSGDFTLILWLKTSINTVKYSSLHSFCTLSHHS